MGSFPLHLRAAQHPLAGLARTSFNSRGWSSAAERAGDSPHGAFPCRSPVAIGTSSPLHRHPPPRNSPRGSPFHHQVTPVGTGSLSSISDSWSATRTMKNGCPRSSTRDSSPIPISDVSIAERFHPATVWFSQAVLSSY